MDGIQYMNVRHEGGFCCGKNTYMTRSHPFGAVPSPFEVMLRLSLPEMRHDYWKNIGPGPLAQSTLVLNNTSFRSVFGNPKSYFNATWKQACLGSEGG